MEIENIAMVAHEVNRAYCISIGDKTQDRWEDAPDWQKQSIISGVKSYIENCQQNEKQSWDDMAARSHEGWLKHKIAEGWVYGPEKNIEKKEHPCLVPFHKLPPEQRTKDYLFLGVVLAMKNMAKIES